MKWSLKILALSSIILGAPTYTADDDQATFSPTLWDSVCKTRLTKIMIKKYELIKKNDIDLESFSQQLQTVVNNYEARPHDTHYAQGVSQDMCDLVDESLTHCGITKTMNIVRDEQRVTAACTPTTLFVNPKGRERYGDTAFQTSLFHEAGHIYYGHGFECRALKDLNPNLDQNFLINLQEQEADLFALKACTTQEQVITRAKFFTTRNKENNGHHPADAAHLHPLERAMVACEMLEDYFASAPREQQAKMICSLEGAHENA